MGLMYTAVFSSVAVTAQQDLFELNAPATGVVYLHSLHLSQSTEAGDAAAEGLALLIKTGATTSGSGGTTPTAVPNGTGWTAFGGTVEVNNTTKATAGTIVTRFSDNWYLPPAYMQIWTPETRIRVAPSARMTVELATTPADSITMSGTITFELV